MRYGLPLLVVAQGLGIFFADRVPVSALGWLCAGGVSVALFGLSRRCWAGRLSMALALAFCAGAFSLALRLHASDPGGARASEDRIVEATVCEGPTYASQSLSMVLCSARWIPGPGSARPPGSGPLQPMSGILLRAYRGQEAYQALTLLLEGDRIRAFLRLRPTQASRNPGGRDERAHFRRQGVGFKGRLLHPALMVRLLASEKRFQNEEIDVFQRVSQLRRRSAEALIQTGAVCSATGGKGGACGGSLLAALALGDRRGITRPVQEAFSRLGLSHLLAVSGLHLVLIAGLAYRLILFVLTRFAGRRPYRDRRPWALGGAILLALSYAVWAGFGVPVQRAWILLAILAPMAWLKRRPPPAWGLFWAALFVLLLEPGALFSLGAQLSFAATAGLLFAFRGVPSEALPGRSSIRVGFERAVRTSLVTIAWTAPILARAGLPVSGAGLLLNLLAVPWTALILLPAALWASGLALLGGEWAMLAVSWAQTLAGWSLRVCMELAALWPDGPQVGPASWWRAGFAGGLALLIALQTRLLRALGLFVCLMAWLLGSSWLHVGSVAPRIVMLDVGQGDAVLLQGRRAAVLIDGGRSFSGGGDMGRSVVEPALRALGVDRLDALVASHADLDHRGGLQHILTRFEVGEVWLPDTRSGDLAFEDLRRLARLRDIPVRELGAGDPRLVVGDLVFEPLWPPEESLETSTNENSLVLRARIAGQRILLTGDIGTSTERALLDRGAALEAELLKVAHHGSAHSSSPDFLRAVGARLYLLSASCSGSSGLPSERTVKRLEAFESEMGWTGREGALLVEFPIESDARLRAWSEPRNCPLGEG